MTWDFKELIKTVIPYMSILTSFIDRFSDTRKRILIAKDEVETKI